MRDHVVVLAASLLAIALMKLQKRFRHRHYFYYGLLLDGEDAHISTFGIAFRTFIPLVTGGLAGLAALVMGLDHSPKFYGLATGFTTGFLCVWPSILCPEQINPPEHARRIKLLYLMRLMFVVLYSVVGQLGGQLASIAAMLLARYAHVSLGSWIDPHGIVTNVISGVVTALIALVAGAIIKAVRQSIAE